MEIRKSTEQDIPRMMEIYARARAFMAAHGNPNQWGPTGWPPEPLIRQDIAQGHSYVCVHEGRVVGTFFFISGEDIEPCYRAGVDPLQAPLPEAEIRRLAKVWEDYGI